MWIRFFLAAIRFFLAKANRFCECVRRSVHCRAQKPSGTSQNNKKKTHRSGEFLKMSIARIRGIALYKRSLWRKELDEAKIDMGLIDPFSQETLDYSLYMAVIEGNYKGIREMAAQGANVDLWLDGKASEPAGTLLHFAVRHGSLKTVIALLQLGADPFARDALNATPRDVAVSRQSGSRMRTVLKLWEQRKTAAPAEDAVISFETLLRTAS